ncbi:MAG: rhamnogalacturonan lyase [Paraprevotella sp.]|nr:rhamnogalacturonan lyase [Paraprevotella sp.]
MSEVSGHRTYEHLGRGVVAVRTSPDTVMVGWRYLSSDALATAFNVYRDGKLVSPAPIEVTTQFFDNNTSRGKAVYEVRPVMDGTECAAGRGIGVLPKDAPCGYVEIPLQQPAGQTMPDGTTCTYTANDVSAADLDGDGEFELVLKWEPSNAKDNSQSGFTGTVFFDAYKMDGTRLWRIDMGRNIRAGAHYSQFMVYDLDLDGRAEMVVKTADGTVDGLGHVIGDPSADYRVGLDHPAEGRKGYIASGPEYLTVFDGRTGADLNTVDYIPPRGNVAAWGDNYANRSERYLAAVAYLDGRHPSVVMCRGYYTRTVLAAFDWDGNQLKSRWVFDTDSARWAAYAGAGNHNLRVADVDGDGCDEITYGACAIDHDGTGLYTTGFGHGDALHLAAFDPASDRLQVWDCYENKRDGSDFRDAATGRVLFRIPASKDVGRCMAADIDPTNYGLEMWSAASGGLRNIKGEVVCADPKGLPANMAVWWDGDLLREMLDRETISKYDWTSHECRPITRFEGCQFNNGSKSNPGLQGDLLGDWREEVVVRTTDSKALRIYVSPCPTPYRFHTFLEDRSYRLSLVTENVAYNQPTQAGFYFGAELEKSGKLFRGFQFGQ